MNPADEARTLLRDVADAPIMDFPTEKQARRAFDCLHRLLSAHDALVRQCQEQETSETRLINQRDRAEDAADNLAYALFGVDEIGEHTNLNDPWQNALDLISIRAALSAHGPEAGGV